MTYRVVWEIDIEDADNPEEAARNAQAILRDPNSIATVFTVVNVDTGAAWKVDLGVDAKRRVTRIIEYPRYGGAI